MRKVLVYGLALWLLKFAVVHIVVNADTTVVAIMNLEKTMHKHIMMKLGNTHSREEWSKMTPREWMKEMSRILNLKIDIKNQNKIPKSGKVIVISNHDNILAGSFIAGVIDNVRDADVTRFIAQDSNAPGNMNLVKNTRLIAGAEDKIKSHLDQNNPLVIFPKTADYSTAHQDNRNPEFRFMDGFLRFAIQNESDILPVKVHLDYPWWWRIMWFIVPHHLGHALLKTYMYHIFLNTTLHITIGDVIPYSKIKLDKATAYIKRGKTRYPERVVQKYQDAIVRL